MAGPAPSTWSHPVGSAAAHWAAGIAFALSMTGFLIWAAAMQRGYDNHSYQDGDSGASAIRIVGLVSALGSALFVECLVTCYLAARKVLGARVAPAPAGSGWSRASVVR